MAKRASGANNSRGGHRRGPGGDRGATGELQRAGEWAAGYADARSDSERDREPATITTVTCSHGNGHGYDYGCCADRLPVRYSECHCDAGAIHYYANSGAARGHGESDPVPYPAANRQRRSNT